MTDEMRSARTSTLMFSFEPFALAEGVVVVVLEEPVLDELEAVSSAVV